jgi:hypothetical protein
MKFEYDYLRTEWLNVRSLLGASATLSRRAGDNAVQEVVNRHFPLFAHLHLPLFASFYSARQQCGSGPAGPSC